MSCLSMYTTVRVQTSNQAAAKRATAVVGKTLGIQGLAPGVFAVQPSKRPEVERLFKQVYVAALAAQELKAEYGIEFTVSAAGRNILVQHAGGTAVTVFPDGKVQSSLEGIGVLPVMAISRGGVQLRMDNEAHGGADHVHVHAHG